MSTLTAQSVANTTTNSNQKGGRLINKDKKSQLNKPTQNASNSAQSTGDNNHANHLNEGSKLDSKLQPTAEQIRIANLMNENIDDNEIQKKVEQIMELTGSTRDDAVVALHDCDNDTAKAVDMILEGDNNAESEWKSTNKKKKTPKATNANEKDESKVNGNKEAKHDETTESNKPAYKGDRRGRGANNRIVRDGPPRLQKTAQQMNKGKKPRDFVDKKTERTERTDKPPFERDESNTANITARRSDKPTGESRRGRGSNSSVSRGNRGGRSRTFQNRGLQNDGFPNSIDTWTNSTADQKPVPSNDCNTMTVGNWSDIVANEDWSEEDWDSNHMETKVFTSRIKVLPEEEVPTTQSLDFSSIFNKANSSVEQSAVQQQTISSMIQNNLPRNTSNSAGNALLQQIQQATSSAPSMTQYSSLTSDYNKQAAASIKSLVGISSTYNSSDLLPSSTQEIVNSDLLANSQSRHSQLQQSNLSNIAKQHKFKSMRPSKIPESAVEMPTNDQIAKLDVQFGGLEFGSDSLSFSLGNEVFQEPVGHVKGNKVATGNASTLLGGDTNYRQSNNMTDITNKSLSSATNQVKNAVIGHQNLTAEALLDRASKSVGHYGQSNLVDIGKKDFSSLNSQNLQGDNFKTTYSNESAYNSSYSNVTTNYSYTNSQSSNYYSNSFSANPTSNPPSNKLNLDNSQNKHYDVSTGQVTNVGTMGLVSTTNVLKNSLSATGKTLHNVAHPVQTMGQYIHINQAPAVPLAAYPFAYDFMPNAGRDHNFAPYTSQDGKYNRGSETDISSVSTSQPVASSQTHNQAFVNFPPGYGAFYFHPGVVPGIQQSIYGATPMYQVNPATNTGTTNSAFQKANTGYGSHSYGSGYDSLSSAQTQDYVKSGYNSSTQHAKNISAANTSDLTGANQSMYGKTHTQLTKNYDKQTFQTNTPPPLTFGNSNLASQTAYGQPYTMLNQAQTSLHHGLQQDPSKVGATGQRTMASHKPSGQNAGTYYGNWN